jgi:aconitate hydratase
VEIVRGPNIKPAPVGNALEDAISAPVLLVAGDNVSTDDIMPAGAKVLPFRSNVPAISEFCLTRLDPQFPARAKAARDAGTGGIIVGGVNYGQGSSREHAAIAPMYLGVKAVIVRSFARIHRANLINYGILPLVFEKGELKQGDVLEMSGLIALLKEENETSTIVVHNKTRNTDFTVTLHAAKWERDILLAGGLIPYTARGGAL